MERYHDSDEHPDEEPKPEPADVPAVREPTPEPQAEPAAETPKQPEVANNGEASLNPEPRRLADARLNGDANDVGQLNAALGTLESTDVGKQIGKDIRDNNVGIQFGDAGEGAIASYNPKTNQITLDDSLRKEDSAVIAAHLAHEGTHAQWFAQGIERDSIDQEYHAEVNEAAVWDTLKGDKTDDQCDFISNEIAQGEADAKLQIKQRYPSLPDRWP